MGRGERGENPDGQQELHVCRKWALPVPADAIMKELASAQAQGGKDVLEVGGGTCRGTQRRRIEGASTRREEEEAGDTAADLEAPRVEVLVRQAIAREV
jgi:hypothetical protein